MADFKQLRGNRLLLDLPNEGESKLIVDENTKEALEKEILQKLDKLNVYAVGDLVTDIKVGDKVLVEPSAIRGKAVVFTIGGERKILVSPFDVVLIW